MAICVIAACLADPALLLHRLIDFDTGGPYGGSPEHMIATDHYRTPVDLLVLGGSSVGAAIPANEGPEAAVKRKCGSDPSIVMAWSNAQHTSDGWAVLDALKGPPPKAILIGLTAGRVDPSRGGSPYSLAGQTLALPHSPQARRLAWQHAAIDTGWFDFFGQARRMQASLGTAVFRKLKGPVAKGSEADLWAYGRDGAAFDAQLALLVAGDLGNPSVMTAYWGDFARTMQKRGSHVYFLWTPISPAAAEFDRKTAVLRTQVLQDLGQMADVIDVSDGHGLSETDFFDALHTNRLGARRLWPLIIARGADKGLCAAIGGK